MAWGAVFGGWALLMAGAYFENLGNSADYRYLFASIAAGVLAAVLFGRHIRWSRFLRRPRDGCSATVAACQRGGRALLLNPPWDGFSSGLMVRFAWWAGPGTLLPGGWCVWHIRMSTSQHPGGVPVNYSIRGSNK
jgi:hypothetical protein